MNKKAVRLQLLTALEKKMRHEVRVSGRGWTHNHFNLHPRADCGGLVDLFLWPAAAQDIYAWVLMRNRRRRSTKILAGGYFTGNANPLSATRKR